MAAAISLFSMHLTHPTTKLKKNDCFVKGGQSQFVTSLVVHLRFCTYTWENDRRATFSGMKTLILQPETDFSQT